MSDLSDSSCLDCDPALLAALEAQGIGPSEIQALEAYADWTVVYWSEREQSLYSLSIMSTGLAGESGELLEQIAFVGTCKEDAQELCLEFGDVMFNMMRTIRYFEISLLDVLLVDWSLSPLPAGHARLPISVGMVSEAVKKHIRNDKMLVKPSRILKIKNAMGLLFQDWWTLRERHGMSLSDLIEANRAKLIKRERVRQQRQRKSCAAAGSADLGETVTI